MFYKNCLLIDNNNIDSLSLWIYIYRSGATTVTVHSTNPMLSNAPYHHYHHMPMNTFVIIKKQSNTKLISSCFWRYIKTHTHTHKFMFPLHLCSNNKFKFQSVALGGRRPVNVVVGFGSAPLSQRAYAYVFA